MLSIVLFLNFLISASSFSAHFETEDLPEPALKALASWQAHVSSSHAARQFQGDFLDSTEPTRKIWREIQSDRDLRQAELYTQFWRNGAWADSTKLTVAYNEGTNQIFEILMQVRQNGVWVNDMNIQWAYDGNNNQTQQILQTWENGAWVNSWKTQWTYDGDNNQTELISQAWENGAWANSYKEISTYENGLNTEILAQMWQEGTWVDFTLTTYSYDSEGRVIEEIYQMQMGGEWFGQSKTLYTYTGDLLTERLEQSWEYWPTPGWTNSSRTFYTYENGDLIEELQQTADFMSGILENNNRISYTYDNGHITEELQQIFGIDNSVWIDNNLISYTYDGNWNQIEELTQYSDGVSWVNSEKETSAYNDENFPTEVIYQEWQENHWENQTKDSYVYEDGESSGTVTVPDMVSYIFDPNLTPEQLEDADVNGDGEVNIVDLILLINQSLN
ncbi:MAG: hypothetical protein B6244_01765 [Candidatus Cloacimonetes bacterium 4572_55]|nr:MAG: hypothetical protein B6244_01765 [Candidatus Cloacimonetes bacterium 4572_55]